MKILLEIVLILFLIIPLNAQQNDSIAYSLVFYFEDAVGNIDSVEISGSPYVNGDEITASFGEVNLVNVPFDSIFEARVTNAINLRTANSSINYIGKNRVLQYTPTDFGPFPCDWNGGIGTFAFVVNIANPPLTISWDPRKFRREPNIGCLMSTNIVNSFVTEVFQNWWVADAHPGLDYACLAKDSSITFYPFDTPTGLDLDWGTYAVLPIEGSDNNRDTLPAYYLNFAYSGTAPPPCNTLTDTEEPDYEPTLESVFPNPTTDVLQFSESSPGARFTVFTTDGRRVLEQVLDGAGQVRVASLPPGLYFYQVGDGVGRRRTGKFVRR